MNLKCEVEVYTYLLYMYMHVYSRSKVYEVVSDFILHIYTPLYAVATFCPM